MTYAIELMIIQRMSLLAELRETTTSAVTKEELVNEFETRVDSWQRNFETYLKPWMSDYDPVVAPTAPSLPTIDDDVDIRGSVITIYSACTTDRSVLQTTIQLPISPRNASLRAHPLRQKRRPRSLHRQQRSTQLHVFGFACRLSLYHYPRPSLNLH